MTGRDIAASLQQVAGRLRGLGVDRIYAFGSAVHGDAQAPNDVDLFIDPVPGTRFGFTRYFEVKEVLEAALARPVDLGTRAMLHPSLRADIERGAVRVL